MSPDEKSRLQTAVLHLAAACPHESKNPDFCPLHGVRLLSDVDKYNWIQSLSIGELDYLARYHEVCFQTLTSQLSPESDRKTVRE